MPGAGSRPRTPTRPRPACRRSCGAGPGGCCATCCARTGRRPGSSWSSSSPPTWPSWPGRTWSAGASTQIPRLTRTHDAAPLILLIGGFAVAVAVQALTTRAYIGGIGQLGSSVVLELRRRLFVHFQRLPIAFHERYTSGRVISRQVSDIDSIQDLFEDGLDTLVSAVFTLLLVGTGMLLLDWELALVIFAGFIPLLWLSAWFRRESALVLPAHPGDDRPGHRALRGDLRRHPGGAGVPPRGPQRGDLHRPQRGLRRRQPARRPG